jgi:hypothetical protein
LVAHAQSRGWRRRWNLIPAVASGREKANRSSFPRKAQVGKVGCDVAHRGRGNRSAGPGDRMMTGVHEPGLGNAFLVSERSAVTVVDLGKGDRPSGTRRAQAGLPLSAGCGMQRPLFSATVSSATGEPSSGIQGPSSCPPISRTAETGLDGWQPVESIPGEARSAAMNCSVASGGSLRGSRFAACTVNLSEKGPLSPESARPATV